MELPNLLLNYENVLKHENTQCYISLVDLCSCNNEIPKYSLYNM